MAHDMDDLDRRILEAAQRGLPVDPAPYARLAEAVGSDETTVFARITALLDAGTIRRLAAGFDSRRLGHAATLVALRLPSDRVAEVAALVNRYPEVTHNYERADSWNLWFTIIARDAARLREILDQLRREAALDPADVMDLPVERLFKIDVQFPTR
jgi:DNA-binding Lrp family transcriptional regulator